jgi:hypothetical protein
MSEPNLKIGDVVISTLVGVIKKVYNERDCGVDWLPDVNRSDDLLAVHSRGDLRLATRDEAARISLSFPTTQCPVPPSQGGA